MTIEAAQTINELNTSYPRSTDLLREGDDHIRMVKATLQRTFPRITGTVNVSSDKLNALDSLSAITSGGIVFNTGFLAQDVSAGTRTSGQAGTLRLLTNTDREINFSIPQNRADTVVTNKTTNITTWDFGNIHFFNISNLNAYNGIFGGAVTVTGDVRGKTIHSDSTINAGTTIAAGDRVVGIKGVTIGQGGGGSPGADLSFYAGDQTLNTELQIKDYGSGAVWAQNWNYTNAIQSMDFNGLDIRGRNLYCQQNVFAGTSYLGTDGNVHGGAWGGDLKGYIVNNYLNDIQYQNEQTIHLGATGSTIKTPGGGFVTGYHQGTDSNGRYWLEDLYYRNLVKRLGSGAAFIIPAQP